MTEPPQPRKRRALTYTEMMNSGTQQPAVGAHRGDGAEETATANLVTRDADQNGKEC